MKPTSHPHRDDRTLPAATPDDDEPNRQKGYTLLELMLVMIIIGIIASLVVPLVQHVMTSGGVESATKIVTEHLNLARMNAMAKRKYVAVIMPGPNATQMSDARRYATVRLAIVTKVTGNDYNFVSWLPRSQWEYLPKGTSIMEADDDTGIYDGAAGAYSKIPVDDSFMSVDNVDLAPIGGSAAVDNVRAVVYSPGAKIDGDTRYVTVGEAVYMGGWHIKNPDDAAKNKSSSNQNTLLLNRFTGGIKEVSMAYFQ